jgi:hypothetical protein
LEPRILLLDEPTSALDVSVQAEILNLLGRLKAELGLTMMLVSHNLAVVAHMADRLAVMRQGEIVERLDVERLRRGEAEQPYTRQLLIAARGYDRQLADTLLDDPADHQGTDAGAARSVPNERRSAAISSPTSPPDLPADDSGRCRPASADARCTPLPPYRDATQAVPGEGRPSPTDADTGNSRRSRRIWQDTLRRTGRQHPRSSVAEAVSIAPAFSSQMRTNTSSTSEAATPLHKAQRQRDHPMPVGRGSSARWSDPPQVAMGGTAVHSVFGQPALSPCAAINSLDDGAHVL